MSQQVYASEAELQELIEHHPDLLSADGEPRRWLLIAREFGIASEPDGSDRWSVDHLFIDDSAFPTLVEVKRSTDTRIRRKVVGADARLRRQRPFALELGDDPGPLRGDVARGSAQGRDRPGPRGDIDPEEFWSQVETNLAAGRMRLMFVADVIPNELRAIVEFLNQHMAQVKVLALELRQYVDAAGQHQTLVPTLVGETQAARQAKGHRQRRDWDRESWLSSYQRNAANPRRRSSSGYSDGPTNTTRRSRSRSAPPPGRGQARLGRRGPSLHDLPRVHRRISRSSLRRVLKDAAVRPPRRTSRDPEPPEPHPEREDRRATGWRSTPPSTSPP